jgi:hypothetical protein
MRLALVALALTLPAASSAEAPSPSAPPAAAPVPSRAAGAFVPSRICGDSMKPRDARSGEALKPRRLGELPGDLTLTVVNRVGDCMEPVVVRQGYGGAEDSGSGR